MSTVINNPDDEFYTDGKALSASDFPTDLILSIDTVIENPEQYQPRTFILVPSDILAEQGYCVLPCEFTVRELRYNEPLLRLDDGEYAVIESEVYRRLDNNDYYVPTNP